MKFNFFIFSFVLLLMIVNVSALSWNVCIDKQAPEAPSDISVSGNVLLSWNEASDLPETTSECVFGIEYYNVYLDGVLIGTSSDLSYSGEQLSDGVYIFGVSAVDRAGNEGERAIKEVVFPLVSSPVVDNGGSSGGSHSSGSGDSSGGGSNKDVVVVSSAEGNDSSSSEDRGASDLGFSEFEDSGISDGEQKGGFMSLLTGAVIGGGIVDWTLALIFILLVIWALFLIIKKRKDSEGVVVSSAKAASSRARKTAKKSGVASKRTSKKK